MNWLTLLQGDVLERLQGLTTGSVHCVVTSPPYWGLRDYGVEGQIGLEETPDLYVSKMVEVFREVRRVLRDDGTLWLNLGDTYAGDWGLNYNADQGAGAPPPRQTPDWQAMGLRRKCQIGIPWRVALALQADGWYLRSDIVWNKPNPMPESVSDRPTKAHEYIFLLSKAVRYFFDQKAVRQPVSENTNARISKKAIREITEHRATGGLTNSHGIAGVNPKAAANAPGCRANASFAASASMPVVDRNIRTVWTVPACSFSGSHFATFPPDLIKPCILAGTSAIGCCPACGAPRERKMEKTTVPNPSHCGSSFDKGKTREAKSNHVQQGDRFLNIDIGFSPTCDCPSDTSEPCIVLDPFGGSGTTGMVAIELGRRAMLIELKPEYCEMIRERCSVTPGLPL